VTTRNAATDIIRHGCPVNIQYIVVKPGGYMYFWQKRLHFNTKVCELN